jgi:hypothetical protein
MAHTCSRVLSSAPKVGRYSCAAVVRICYKVELSLTLGLSAFGCLPQLTFPSTHQQKALSTPSNATFHQDTHSPDALRKPPVPGYSWPSSEQATSGMSGYPLGLASRMVAKVLDWTMTSAPYRMYEKETYQYVKREIQRDRESASARTPLNVCLIFKPARGALGRAMSANCFFK